MTTATLPYAEVARELAKWGFRFVSFRREVLKLSGSLKCEFGLVPVDLHIRDWEFVNYPVIRILERPKPDTDDEEGSYSPSAFLAHPKSDPSLSVEREQW